MQSDTEAFWANDFGNKYLDRNRVNWHMRVPFWGRMADMFPDANSALEVGCNAGWNLRALQVCRPKWRLVGIDINERAVEEAQAAGVLARVGSAELSAQDYAGHSDIVFTAGLLIHIAPEQLPYVMRNIVLAARHAVVAVEYESAQEEEVEYRGHAGKLWKRDFGALYQELGMKLAYKAPAGLGFDDCTAWVLTK